MYSFPGDAGLSRFVFSSRQFHYTPRGSPEARSKYREERQKNPFAERKNENRPPKKGDGVFRLASDGAQVLWQVGVKVERTADQGHLAPLFRPFERRRQGVAGLARDPECRGFCGEV